MNLSAYKNKAVAAITKIPYFILRKLSGVKILMPFYHIVSNEDVIHIKHLEFYKNEKEFKDDLELFKKKYTPIDMPKLLNHVQDRKGLPGNALLLTFDDGFREQQEIIAPILKEQGIPAVFFINSDFIDNNEMSFRHKASILIERIMRTSNKRINKLLAEKLGRTSSEFYDIRGRILSVSYDERHIFDELAGILGIGFEEYLKKYQPYLNSEQVFSLINDGFHIGSHSIDHPKYSLLSIGDQIYQTKEGIKWIKKKFGVDYSVFAFPFNDEGISLRYFEEIGKNGWVDLSFGTAGLQKHSIKNHFQRIWVGNPAIPTGRVIKTHYIKEIIGFFRNRNKVIR